MDEKCTDFSARETESKQLAQRPQGRAVPGGTGREASASSRRENWLQFSPTWPGDEGKIPQPNLKASMSLPAFDSIYFIWMVPAQRGGQTSALVTLPVLTASRDLHGHPTQSRRDSVRCAAGHWDEHRVQFLARAWPRADLSWADPASAHSSASAPMAGLGGSTMVLPNPSLRSEPRGTNVSIPPAPEGHPAGISLLVPTRSVACRRARGAQAAPGPCQGPPPARNKLIPTSHHDAKAQLLFKAINHLQAVGSGQK